MSQTQEEEAVIDAIQMRVVLAGLVKACTAVSNQNLRQPTTAEYFGPGNLRVVVESVGYARLKPWLDAATALLSGQSEVGERGV